MNNYAVEVKPPARKELEALPDNVLSRVVRKVESLGHTPQDAKNCRVTKISGVSGWVTGALVYVINDTAKLVSVTRIAHRREVYE